MNDQAPSPGREGKDEAQLPRVAGEEEERPPFLSMLILVASPFVLMVLVALLYLWIRG